ncbi:hypothetical protein CgunFtcFv8_008379 [Champsocephalus gunnari]|uniref:Uncharacterized protein n=1 Tax=Champsocephalus gunnari TaxID=52237 RepID=A0AAN8D050_CHAGU|nr:hypothetical protein CgunFtcFv8_008379 [Champsocephalus gunnari]
MSFGIVWEVGQQDDMGSWSSRVPGLLRVMDDRVNVCDCRARWPASGGGEEPEEPEEPECAVPSVSLL